MHGRLITIGRKIVERNDQRRKQMKATTTVIYRAITVFAFACLGLLPKAQAVTPAPDGGYPGGNTAEGQNALLSLTTGGFNTAVGFFSLSGNTTGSFNTAIGVGALLANTGDTAVNNTATGAGALLSNATGGDNTANGAFALFSNTIGTDNTAAGVNALSSNMTGSSNVAYGDFTLFNNITGSNNIALGYTALRDTTGSNNIGLGTVAGINLTTGDNNVDIDNQGVAGESNTIRIGNGSHTSTFVAGISGGVLGGTGIPVLVDAAGQLGTISSSRQFKKEIRPMENASEAILALEPVTFRYKTDTTNTPQFGLIAEEVAKINPDLVVRDKNGQIYTVRYDAVNAMLLNEFLKEHKQVEEQQTSMAALKVAAAQQRKDFESAIARQRSVSDRATAQQQKEIHALTVQLKEQAAHIQKISTQVQITKTAKQVATR
jgi:hypothetical protein